LKENERAATVELSGDLDVYRRAEIEAVLPAPDSIDRLVLDMRTATTVDSSIIAVIMRYRRTFADAGGDPHDIVLVVPPNLRRLFEITGLVTLLTVVTAEPLAEA
jgi:anti-anti-sigma factor